MDVSVVIITLNEESNIADCIRSAQLISDDVVVVDSGSRDRTVELSKQQGARVFSVHWSCYGFSRNFGALQAKYDWIFSLDADERITSALAKKIHALRFKNVNAVYKFRRENYLEGKRICFGNLGFETVKRMYNRNAAEWDLSLVHEKLISHSSRIQFVGGTLQHYGLKSYEAFKSKAVLYAQMSAEKYFIERRKINWLKRVGSPIFNSIKSYIFQFGFLDGKRGIFIAHTIAQYSWLKYCYLHHLYKEEKNPAVQFSEP